MNIFMTKMTTEVVTPAEYLKLKKEQKSNIKDVFIIPPKLGENSFGKLQINYKDPIYKVK